MIAGYDGQFILSKHRRDDIFTPTRQANERTILRGFRCGFLEGLQRIVAMRSRKDLDVEIFCQAKYHPPSIQLDAVMESVLELVN